jgi:hypothetical protein
MMPRASAGSLCFISWCGCALPRIWVSGWDVQRDPRTDTAPDGVDHPRRWRGHQPAQLRHSLRFVKRRAHVRAAVFGRDGGRGARPSAC